MDRSFLFVDGTEVDSTTRKLIRRHVMNGKNAGKTVRRRSRLDLARQSPHQGHHRAGSLYKYRASNEEDIRRIDGRRFCIVASSRCLGLPFRTLTFPVEPTTHSLEVMNLFFDHVVDKFYPCRLGISRAEAKHWWLQLVLADEAAYHCIVAVSEASIHLFRGGGVSSPEALYHRSQTLTLINKRLDSGDALTDATLGIVSMLVIHEQMRKGMLEAEIHFEGLKKMVELRGGLAQLEQSPPLLEKVCKMDILYALEHGRATSYFRDRMFEARTRLVSIVLPSDMSLDDTIGNHKELTPYLRQVYLDVKHVTSVLEKDAVDRILDLKTFQEMLYSICYRLIRYQTLQSSSTTLSDIDAVCHIGLTIYMMTLFLQIGHRRIMPYELIAVQLRTTVDRNLDELDNNLILWLLFIGGIWIDISSNGSWLFPKIMTMAGRLGIVTWLEIHKVIDKFPWINVLHTEAGRAVWNMACRSSYELP